MYQLQLCRYTSRVINNNVITLIRSWRMKYFLVVFVLFAVSFAQDAGKCQVKVLDSYYMHLDTYGSLFNVSQSNQYLSFVGEVVQVINYLSDNPNGSVMYNNATLVIRNGVTGKIVTAGSFISFRQNGREYSFEVVNGQKSDCTSADSGPVPQYSKILSNLIQIYPFTGIHPRPGESSICQGVINQPVNAILNVVWDQSLSNVLQITSVLSENQSTNTGVNEFRTLTKADEHFLTNPCPKGSENKETNQLIGLIHGALRHHFICERYLS